MLISYKFRNFCSFDQEAEFVWENGNERGSNINEFFEIIDW